MASPSPENMLISQNEAREIFARQHAIAELEPLSRRDLVIWAAGFFDGEGHIGMGRSSHGHYMRLSASQVVRAPLETLQELFGGHIYEEDAGRRPIFRWHISPLPAFAALQEMQPYLRVKGPQARIAIAFQERRAVHFAYRPSDWRERDEADCRELKRLKAI